MARTYAIRLSIPATRIFGASVALGVAVTAMALLEIPADGPARLLPALVFAVFCPGYLLSCVLFPTSAQLDSLTRGGLSLTTSFAITIFLSMLLGITPLGRSRTALLLGVLALVTLLAAMATIRQRLLAMEERLLYVVEWKRSLLLDRYGMIALALLVLITGTTAFSHFFTAGAEATTFSLATPSDVETSAQPTSVQVVVESHEHSATSFAVVVESADRLLGQSAPFTLVGQQTWRGTIAIAPPPGVGPARLRVTLHKIDSSQPYRELDVWVRTVPFRAPSSPS